VIIVLTLVLVAVLVAGVFRHGRKRDTLRRRCEHGAANVPVNPVCPSHHGFTGTSRAAGGDDRCPDCNSRQAFCVCAEQEARRAAMMQGRGTNGGGKNCLKFATTDVNATDRQPDYNASTSSGNYSKAIDVELLDEAAGYGVAIEMSTAYEFDDADATVSGGGGIKMYSVDMSLYTTTGHEIPLDPGAAVYYSSPNDQISIDDAYEVPVTFNPEYSGGDGVPGTNPVDSAAGRWMSHGKPHGSAAPSPTNDRKIGTYSVFIDPPQYAEIDGPACVLPADAQPPVRVPNGGPTEPTGPVMSLYYGDIPTPGFGADYREPAPLAAAAQHSGQHEMASDADADAQSERRSHTIVTAGATMYAIPLTSSSEL